ncbi:MAG: hypothetical protein ACK446_13770 [Rhodobacterales bacterium]|jgi:hypothetical protein
MNRDDALWLLEERLWTSGRDSARSLMASGAIVVLPYPDGILQGDGLWSHPAVNTGWRMVEMNDRTVARHEDVAVLAYRVRAMKPDVAMYEALCASTWLNDGGTWRRLFHQQTPVA